MLLEEQHKWKKVISDIATQLGFVASGFTDSKPIEGLEPFLEKRRDAGDHTSFEEKELSRRVEPKVVWPSCETVVALAYPLPFTAMPQESDGVLARSAVGEDYHRVVTDRMETLIACMADDGWNFEAPRFQVDTGPLNERAFAVRTGIGWIGQNQQLIISKTGSFVSLALMLLDQKIVADEPVANQCGVCRKCVEACPAQIIGKAKFAANQCLSYLTQSKEVLSEEQVTRLDRRLFGCDTCQEVCPHNQAWLRKEESAISKIPRGEDLWRVLELTKGEFNQRFKSTAAGWRGKGILQRNAYLALRKLNDPKFRNWEEERKKDEIPPMIRPYVRG